MSELIKWDITFSKGNRKVETVAAVEFLIEKNRVWLNSIEVTDFWKRSKIASLLIEDAISEFGEIYFSTATKAEHKRMAIDNDCRYLEPDGEELVKYLLEKKIIKPEWRKNPFEAI